ncbi:MAG: ATP-binding protein [Actinomycetota bacterium]|nr:ATP-binding protein [Actinomycetota bacterium]
MPELREAYDGTPEAVASARHAVSRFARQVGADHVTVGDIALAVSEVCSNVVLHAYREPGAEAPVTVQAEQTDHSMRLHVMDHGGGMAPRPDSPGLGFGIPLISHLADVVEVRTPPSGGTEICMEFSWSEA